MTDRKKQGIYYGIDISDKNTLLSYYYEGMEEPTTLSTVMGSEVYQIPTYLAKKRGVGQWFFGNDAIRQTQLSMAVGVDMLLSKAKQGDYILIDTEEYPAEDLLMIFLRKLLTLPQRNSGLPIAKLIITVDTLDEETVELFTLIASRMGLEPRNLLLCDYLESFYYYALSQGGELYLHDVMLFDYSQTNLRQCLLKRNPSTKPQVVNLTAKNHGSISFDKDKSFDEIVRKSLVGEVISSAYLIGDGFDGGWMEASLKRLCQGRRVFMGKNLYSKGACYAGMVKDELVEWPFVYIGDNDLKMNLSLKVIDHNEMNFYTLLTAGDSWFDAGGECEVILDGSPVVEVWMGEADSRKSTVHKIELTELPERENRTTRLRVKATPQSDRQVKVSILDLGFGEIVPSSGKSWEKVLEL